MRTFVHIGNSADRTDGKFKQNLKLRDILQCLFLIYSENLFVVRQPYIKTKKLDE